MPDPALHEIATLEEVDRDGAVRDAEAVSQGKLHGIAAKFAQVVAGDEAAHVAALRKALGSAATKKPSFDFKGTTGSESTFLRTSMTGGRQRCPAPRCRRTRGSLRARR